MTKLDAEIPGGASTIGVLDGTGVQLGSNGGNLVLQDELAHQSTRHLLRERRRRGVLLHPLPAMTEGIDVPVSRQLVADVATPIVYGLPANDALSAAVTTRAMLRADDQPRTGRARHPKPGPGLVVASHKRIP